MPNKNTKYAKENTKYAKQNTKYANQNTKYAKQNTKCIISIKRVRQKNKYLFTLFCRDAFFVANLRTLLAYLSQALKIWWRTKNDKYEVWSLELLFRVHLTSITSKNSCCPSIGYIQE